MASSTGASGAGQHAHGSGALLPDTSYRLIQRLDNPQTSQDGDEVWSARHEQTGIAYALKLFPVSLPGRELLAERLQRVEARMQTGLTHKNLVRVFDIGVAADGRPFFVLEKLSGKTLRDELRARGYLPMPRALEVTVAICDALHAAHGAHAVHRRVRPEAVFVCDDGTVKLLGFGKILDVGVEGVIAPERAPRHDGPYLAPEIAAGQEVDGRADVFSAGVLLYELLAGTPPFAGPRTPATAISPPSVVASQLVPAEIDALVLAAISFDRDLRPPTAGALAAELGAVFKRISAGSGSVRPDGAPSGDAPTRWAGATKRPAPAGEATAIFSLRSAEQRGAENVYTIGPGTMLAGKYRVVRVIGKGGMGLVVEARHVHLDARVAMKFLLPEFMSYAEASGRFLREARAASKLTSVHVARVLDVGTLAAGEPYMVMEYLAGEDLAYHAHARTPLTIGEAIEYITQACDAIGEAHELGIVHRDVKPANLFLTRRADGSPLVKVLDFGISKVLGEGERDVALTQTTTILGSALYMSPEQMQSAKNVDRRTDIYALGVCLFELLGREQPYFAESFPELCAKVFTSPPKPLRAVRPEVPEALQLAIERALARDAHQRYQNVGELLQGLSPFARLDTRSRMETILRRYHPRLRLLPPAPMASTVAFASSSGAAPAPIASEPPSRRRSRAPLIALGCVLAVAGGLGWHAFQQRAGDDAAVVEPSATSAPAEVGAASIEPTAPAEPVAEPVAAAAASLPAASAESPAPTRPATTATVSASAQRGAPAAAKSARRAGESAAATEKTTPERPGASPPTTPPPPVNTDLVQETCKARMPDGSEKVVPCP